MAFQFNFDVGAAEAASKPGEFTFGFSDTKDSGTVPTSDETPAVPAREVHFTEDEIKEASAAHMVSQRIPYGGDEIELLRGQVGKDDVAVESTELAEVVASTDLVPNVYEGGLKLWECALDLCAHMADVYGCLKPDANRGHRVLELGCGHGLPAILALNGGAERVDFSDYNAEVLKKLTLANVLANVPDGLGRSRFFSGGWDTLSGVLGDQKYDFILSSDTLYCPDSMAALVQLIAAHLDPAGIALIAAKPYYFGVGGGTQMFTDAVRAEGTCEVEVACTFADGTTNVREILKVSRRRATAEP